MEKTMIPAIQPLLEFFQSPVFHSLGIFGLFIYAILPSFISPLPNETISAPLLIGGFNPLVIIVVMAAGSFIGDLVMYYLGMHGRRLFNKAIKKADQHHFMHRHGYWFFTLTVGIPYLSESVMIIAGHQHVSLKKISPFVFAGELIRAVIGTAAVLGILTIPDFL